MKTKETAAQRVARNVKRLRALKGLTLQALAEAAKISRTRLCRIEAAHFLGPQLDGIEDLARALGVDIMELFK